MKLLELINSVESLNVLLATKLPAKAAYKLSVFSKLVAPQVDEYNKVRSEKVKIYGEPELDAEGKETGKYLFKDGNGQKFVDELKELEETEFDVAIPDIKLADLGEISIEPKHLASLAWLIKE